MSKFLILRKRRIRNYKNKQPMAFRKAINVKMVRSLKDKPERKNN